jgi:hypothetical protein
MSNEYKDWLTEMQSMNAEETLTEQAICDWSLRDTPFDTMLEIISYNDSIAVYFAFEKLKEKIIHESKFVDASYENILNMLEEIKNEETRNKTPEENLKKRLCPKCRQPEVGTDPL